MAHKFTVIHSAPGSSLLTKPEAAVPPSELSRSIIKATQSIIPSSWEHCLPIINKDKKERLSLAGRVTKLRETLKDIQVSVENRENLLKQARDNPRRRIQGMRNFTWKGQVERDARTFYSISTKIAHHGNTAKRTQVEEWERAVEDLRVNTLNYSELVDEEDAWDEWEVRPGVLKEGWNWKDADGKGPGEDEEIDPLDENVNPDADAGGKYGKQSTGMLRNHAPF